MTIQTQAFTPPEFQPLKIYTYKPVSYTHLTLPTN